MSIEVIHQCKVVPVPVHITPTVEVTKVTTPVKPDKADPLVPIKIINIEYDTKLNKLQDLSFYHKLNSICNKISLLLYNKVLSEVLGKSQNILNKTIKSHENKKYIIIIPICTEKKNKNILEKLEYIKNMVNHANRHNILMKIEYLV